MKKKLKKAKTKEKNKLWIIVLIICVIAFALILLKLNEKDKFKIEPRTDKIQQEKQKDNGNYKTLGWIRIQGTNIDYPVVTDETNEYKNDVEKESFGFSKGNEEKLTKTITVIGHNIYNLGSNPKKTSKYFKRFEEMINFLYYDFAKDNQFIQYTIDGKDYKYQIYAVSFLDELNYILQLNYSDITDTENMEAIKVLKQESLYDYGVKVTGKDKILNIATCTRMFGELNKINVVISAKLVDNNYNKYSKVSKTSKYKDVEKILNGGSKNEENA